MLFIIDSDLFHMGQDFFTVQLLIFSYPSILTCFLGAQKKRLIETVLLSTHNICFVLEIRKSILVTLFYLEACTCMFLHLIEWIIWAPSRENLSSGVPTKRVSNQSPQLQKLARKNEILLVASLDMVLSKTQITKALIRLRGCAGWSVPVLFVNPRRQVFSHRGPSYVP